MLHSENLRTAFVRRTIAPIAVLALLAAGCDDDPTGVDDDDHIEAFGFAIEAEGAELLRHLDGSSATPELTLQAGTTTEVAIVFLDADGEPLPHEEHEGEEEHEFRVTIGNAATVAWTPEEHVEGEEHEHVEFHGELEALAVGSTGMQLCILHEDHCDYESPLIQVDVE